MAATINAPVSDDQIPETLDILSGALHHVVHAIRDPKGYQAVQDEASAKIIAFTKANPKTAQILMHPNWEILFLASIGYTKAQIRFGDGDYLDAVEADELNLKTFCTYFGLTGPVNWLTINRTVALIRKDAIKEKRRVRAEKSAAAVLRAQRDLAKRLAKEYPLQHQMP